LEMQLDIGRYYLYSADFFKANEIFQIVIRTKNCSEKYLGLCFIGLSDIVYHRLQDGGLKSYNGDLAILRTKINNAKKNLLQAQTLYPEFLFYEQKLTHLDDLMKEFGLHSMP
jgi:hypothetical protein